MKVNQWLAQPRPFFERALAGFLPRTLYLIIEQGSAALWAALIVLSAGLLLLITRVTRASLTFNQFMLAGFIINPFVHDYDLIQMIPLLERSRLVWAAVLASIPTWCVIALAYGIDQAWFVVTLIAPLVLIVSLWDSRYSKVDAYPSSSISRSSASARTS